MMSFSLSDINIYFDRMREQLLIDNFVFGPDEKSLRESVGKFGDTYMFVDFGEITSSADRTNVVTDRFEMAVTIAKPLGSVSYTNDDIVQVQDCALSEIVELRRLMYDRSCYPWLKYLNSGHKIQPFVAPDLQRSIGWTLLFNIEGKDLFGIK